MADFYGPWGNPYNTYRTWMSVGYSQSIAGNYTNVSVGAYFQDRYGYGLWGNLRNIVYIAGTLVRDSSHGIAGGANASTYIAGSSLNVGHNADGTIGGIGVSSQMIDVNYYNGTASGTIYVPTIPRATTPNWSGNFVTGTAKTINLPRASTSFTHTVQYAFGSTGFVNIATGAGDSTPWNPPQTLASQIPNAASGTGTIRVITYSGSTNIGTKDVSFTLDLDSTIVPTVSAVTWSDNNSVVATNIGAFVRGLSQVKGVVTSAGVYGSTISSKYVNIGGTTANENVGVLLTGSGTISAVAYSTDSRGRTGSLTQNITSLEYSPPSIISSSVQRAFSNGTPNGEGTYLRVDLNASVSSLIVNSVQKNAMKISVRTKQNGSSWVDRNVINTGLTHNTYFLVSGGGIFSVASSYDVEIAITDNTSVSASAVSTNIPTATVTLDLDGTSVGVGKYHEKGVLDVAGDVYTSGDLYTSGGVVGLSTRVSTLETGYRYVDTLYFTANGTFTKASYPWLRAIRVKVQAGGGSGGGTAATGGSQTSVGGGGGGGAYAESFITDIASLPASVTVTRGAGGTGVANAGGNTGGQSSFGTLVSANGGFGGTRRVASNFYIPADGGWGGTVGVGDVVFGGSGGAFGWQGATFTGGGSGGASHLGGGGIGTSNGSGGGSSYPGPAGIPYGGGGSGASANQNTAAAAGGAGANGIVIVELYA